ncbi:uncharacterized protein LOC117338977 [Pecten maximus]|uniref:uncharacterized protein LOC117338977 n=1 Tax=Pecten maximus TaxID=6579 RepID=UPI001458A1E8|nr:uncharacterized protein LOC117338977 [Pecten maximus]
MTEDQGTGSDTKKRQWNPRFNKIQADVSSFAVMVYGKDQRVILRAINDLEGKLDDTFKRKAIENDIIKTFTPVQEKELMKLRETLQIEVTIEKRLGRIQLLGLPDAISNAVDMIHSLMLEVQRRNQAEQEAQLISDMVQWYFIDATPNGEDLIKYEPSVNRILERGHRDSKNEVEFMDNQKKIYVVDLQTYEEYVKTDPNDKVKIIRRCHMTGLEGYFSNFT